MESVVWSWLTDSPPPYARKSCSDDYEYYPESLEIPFWQSLAQFQGLLLYRIWIKDHKRTKMNQNHLEQRGRDTERERVPGGVLVGRIGFYGGSKWRRRRRWRGGFGVGGPGSPSRVELRLYITKFGAPMRKTVR